MMNRQVQPPFVPVLQNPTDTSLFEKQFTGMPVESPKEEISIN